MKSAEIIKILKQDGWIQCHQKGSHCQFKHLSKPGRVTVPHPKKDLPIKTVKSIWKQAALDEMFLLRLRPIKRQLSLPVSDN